MQSPVTIGNATLYLGDCREILPTLAGVDAVVADPPYGMDWNTDTTRFSGGKPENKRGPGRDDWGGIEGDDEPFDPAHLLGFPEVVLWGSNHYSDKLPPGGQLVWIKRHVHLTGTFLSDAEVAWRKNSEGVFVAYLPYSNVQKRLENTEDRSAHPNQKPVQLMEWCLDMVKGNTVVDPYMGSGSTGIAALRKGRRFIGIEKSERHFQTACRRIEASQGALV